MRTIYIVGYEGKNQVATSGWLWFNGQADADEYYLDLKRDLEPQGVAIYRGSLKVADTLDDDGILDFVESHLETHDYEHAFDEPLSMLEILDETIEYYTHNPRGITDGEVCLYLTEDGKKCAVGRCLVEGRIPTTFEGGVPSLVRKYGTFLLKPQYRGYKEAFWTDLQTLHDRSYYWVVGGLNDEGERYVNEIKTNINNDYVGYEDIVIN